MLVCVEYEHYSIYSDMDVGLVLENKETPRNRLCMAACNCRTSVGLRGSVRGAAAPRVCPYPGGPTS